MLFIDCSGSALADPMDKLLGGPREGALMMHIGTNDKVREGWSVLKNNFMEVLY